MALRWPGLTQLPGCAGWAPGAALPGMLCAVEAPRFPGSPHLCVSLNYLFLLVVGFLGLGALKLLWEFGMWDGGEA